MAFFWMLHAGTGGGTVFSMGDINGVYETACAPDRCTGDQPWGDLEVAAVERFGPLSPHATRFADVGDVAGVDLNAP